MKLKTIEKDGVTYAEVQDGKPVYIHDDGKESPFDAPGTLQTISARNAEAKSHREAKEAAEAKLKVFEGLDPEAAREALDKIGKLDTKKLVEAGDMDAAIKQAIKPYEEKLAATTKLASELEAALDNEMIGGSFSRSKFVSEKMAIPVDMVQSYFGRNFKREDGKVVGYDRNGNKIFSRVNGGELAGFDEALQTMVEDYPNRDFILKGTGSRGGGSKEGGDGGGSKTMARSKFDSLPHSERGKAAREYTIVDG